MEGVVGAEAALCGVAVNEIAELSAECGLRQRAVAHEEAVVHLREIRREKVRNPPVGTLETRAHLHLLLLQFEKNRLNIQDYCLFESLRFSLRDSVLLQCQLMIQFSPLRLADLAQA